MDIRALTEGCSNLMHLDLSEIPSIDNRLIGKALEKLNKLETFIVLKNTKISYEVFVSLSINCPQLKRLEIGGLPTDFNT